MRLFSAKYLCVCCIAVLILFGLFQVGLFDFCSGITAARPELLNLEALPATTDIKSKTLSSAQSVPSVLISGSRFASHLRNPSAVPDEMPNKAALWRSAFGSIIKKNAATIATTAKATPASRLLATPGVKSRNTTGTGFVNRFIRLVNQNVLRGIREYYEKTMFQPFLK